MAEQTRRIVICSSVTFFPQYNEIAEKLEGEGIIVDTPERKMEFPMEVDEEKTSVRGFFESQGGIDNFPPDHEVWRHKAEAMRAHVRRIDKADATLVTNYDKNGIENYIGANTFLEMFYAFLQDKPIYVLNPLPDMRRKEELLGMQPIILNNDLSKITQ